MVMVIVRLLLGQNDRLRGWQGKLTEIEDDLVSRVDDRRVVSGIVHVIRNGLRWRDAPAVYGPHKTLYNRFVRWSRMGIFDRIFANLAAESGPPDRVMIDSTHLKAHRTAASLLKRGIHPVSSAARKAG
jgi:putative transposase